MKDAYLEKTESFIEDKTFMTKDKVDKYFGIVSSPDIPWFFNSATIDGNYDGTQTVHLNDTKDEIMFTHVLYNNGFSNSPLYETMMEPFLLFCEKNNIFVRSIIRAKINMTVSSENNMPTPAHVDFPYPQKVFLYYYNDSDGDTIFYKEKYNGEEIKNLTEEKRISPEAGKGIMFDGLTYHSPSPPHNSKIRIVLNVVFL